MPLLLNGFFLSNLVSDILKRCIQRVLDVPAEASAVFVDRFLLSLLSHAAKDQDHNRAIQDIQGGCSCENFFYSLS